MDESHEKDALWDLLGRGPKTEASPFFVQKVMRAIEQEERPRFSLPVFLRWLTPVAACAALLAGWTAWQQQREQQEEFNAYFDSAADLQSLVVYEVGSAWVDAN